MGLGLGCAVAHMRAVRSVTDATELLREARRLLGVGLGLGLGQR